jgi:hypothetical protein
VIAVGVGAFLAREATARAGLPLAEGEGLPFVGERGGGAIAASVALSVLGRE